MASLLFGKDIGVQAGLRASIPHPVKWQRPDGSPGRRDSVKLAGQMKITQALDSYGARFESCLPQPGTECSHLSAPQGPHQCYENDDVCSAGLWQ